MKQIIVAFLLLLTIGAHSQTNDAVLNKRLAEYMAYSKDLKVDQLLTYMYPRMFELAKKEDLKKVLESAFTNPDIDIKLDSLEITKVDPITKFSKGSFTRFSYSVIMRFKLLSEKLQENTEAVKENFASQFGEANVRYDEETKVFSIAQTKEALAIKDNFSKNVWTMLGLEKNMSMAKILPIEVRNKYKIK